VVRLLLSSGRTRTLEKGEAVEDSATTIENVLRDHLAKLDAVLAELPADRDVEALKATVTERRWGGLASSLSEDWPDRYDISGRGREIARFELVSMSAEVAVVRSCELQFIQDVPVGEDDDEGLIGAGLPVGLKRTFVLRDGRWLLDETVHDAPARRPDSCICSGRGHRILTGEAGGTLGTAFAETSATARASPVV
jgi:hypothetical protein